MKKNFYYSAICLLAIIIFSCQKPKLSEEANNESNNSGSAYRTSSSISILQWQKCFGSTATDDGYSIASSKDGVTGVSTGYFLVGTTNGNNGNVSGSRGLNDGWLVKTDLNGNFLWQLVIGGTDYDYGKGVVATDDGGCIVAIEARSKDGDFAALGIRGGLVLAKVNSSGTIVWKQRYGGSGSDVPHAMIKTSDGGVAITGYTSSPDLEGAPLINHNGSNVWLIKLNPVDIAGAQPYTISVQRTFGIPTGTNGESAYSIVQTVSGGYAMAGVTYSIVNGSTRPDIWVVNAGTDGSQLWTKTLGDAGSSDVSFGITSSTSDGGVVITGFIGLNLVVAKLDASGTISWQTIYVAGRGQAVIPAADGYVVTGSTGSRKGELFTTNGGEDMILVKLGFDGSKKISYSFGGTGSERGRGIIPSADGNGFMALGSTSSNNGAVSGNHGGNDFWMVKLNAP
jgi:hypothetical protein